MSPEKTAAKASKLADTCATQIKKQMKWQVLDLIQSPRPCLKLMSLTSQPSCKQGRSKWSYENSVSHPAIFHNLFPTLPSNKAWKQKKLPVRDFEGAVGEIRASVRDLLLS